MNFASYEFILVFLPLTLGLFAILPGQRTRQWLLVGASMVFYAIEASANAGFLLATMAVNYLLASQVLTKYTGWPRQKRLAALWFGVMANLGCLLGFKIYALQEASGQGFRVEQDILIPLAISFITFQQIGFLTACYRQQIQDVSLSSYLFFIAFFPQLILGPIVRYEDMNRQLQERRLQTMSLDNLAVGLAIFVFGLAKKVSLADSIAVPVDRIFVAVEAGPVQSIELLYAMVGFQLQLFLDFSAYADMAIGLARIFGIDLPVNFDRPFFARDRFDLWRRWHITFAIFMRSHVFRPLVRTGWVSPVVALMVTAVLSGLWHGLGWTFVAWGLIQAMLMLGSHYRRHWWGRGRNPAGTFALPAVALTFATNSLLGTVFRSPDFSSLLELMRQLFANTPAVGLIGPYSWGLLLLGALSIWVLPDTSQLFHRYWRALDLRPKPLVAPKYATRSWLEFRINSLWAVVWGALFVACLLLLGAKQRFVYVQF